jgi:hypothetical protein
MNLESGTGSVVGGVTRLVDERGDDDEVRVELVGDELLLVKDGTVVEALRGSVEDQGIIKVIGGRLGRV